MYDYSISNYTDNGWDLFECYAWLYIYSFWKVQNVTEKIEHNVLFLANTNYVIDKALRGSETRCAKNKTAGIETIR